MRRDRLRKKKLKTLVPDVRGQLPFHRGSEVPSPRVPSCNSTLAYTIPSGPSTFEYAVKIHPHFDDDPSNMVVTYVEKCAWTCFNYSRKEGSNVYTPQILRMNMKKLISTHM